MLAPAALSLLTTTFTDPDERGKAFGIYAGIAGIGGAIGLLLGGFLTEVLDWRWCLYVSIAFAVPAAIAGCRLLQHPPAGAGRPRIDVPGSLTASSGLFALVYGLARGESDGWGDPVTVAFLIGSAMLLAGFVAIERRVANPLLPLRVVADRARSGSFLAIGIASAGIFGVLLFLTFYLQDTKGMSALETGLAFLPMSFSIAPTVALTSTRLLPRLGPRPLVPAGMTTAAVGMALLTRIEIDTAYASHVLPSLILIGVGFGLILGASFPTATADVPARDSGVASAMVNTSQQVGGSLGTALLSTLAVSATTAFVTDHGPAPEALRHAAVDGYTTAFWWAAAIFAVGAVVCGALLRSLPRPPSPPPCRSPHRRTRKRTIDMQTPPPTPRPATGEMLWELADLASGAVVMLLPLLLLAMPGIALFVVLPALVLLAVAVVPVAVAGAIVAPVYLLVRLLRRLGRRGGLAPQRMRAERLPPDLCPPIDACTQQKRV